MSETASRNKLSLPPKPLKTMLARITRGSMAKDPVCGMDVDEESAKWRSEYEGKTYYFCAERCKLAFDKNPKRFVR